MTGFVVFSYLVGVPATAVLFVKLGRLGRGQGGHVHDRYEAAFLNGGPARVVDTAIASLHADGRLAVGGPGIVRVLRPTAHDPVERAVLQELAGAASGALGPLRIAVMRHPAVQEVGDALAARGLLMEPRPRRSAAQWGTFLGFLGGVLTLFSFFFTLADLTGPGGGVPLFLLVLPVLAAWLTAAVLCTVRARRRVTPAGRAAVAAYGRDRGHADPGLLVALRGLRSLPDPGLREQLTTTARTYRPPRPVIHPASSHARSSSSSSSSSPLDAAVLLPVVWCAAAAGGESGGGGCGGAGSCSGSGSCSGGGVSCSSWSGSGSGSGSPSSSCSSGGSSCSSGGSSCSSSSSSCSSSSSSSCSSSSSSSCSSGSS
ncbi:TIGR04222 domain-containing membrane protein [Streptomyces roseicoloratus]|uniref:TIGR04222 domain-containing membrane protein n=1 Tax=Streptomyces roseicoloratus TaxID=2508722 RepID=UPI0010099658|nr:TIGR04222 domain-containing membrane protein [Streptomyces roseicoloratus]